MASKDKAFYSKNTLNVNGNLIDLSAPKIMGILNVTEDSFYDGGRYLNEMEISKQAEKLITIIVRNSKIRFLAIFILLDLILLIIIKAK